MTLKDLIRLNARKLRSHFPRIRVWKIDALKMGYISIPKSASSSIRRYLTAAMKEIGDEQETARVSLTPAQISKLREEIFLFSFVRNPLTRLYSCYRDKLGVAQEKYETCTLSHFGLHYGMSFEDFVRRVVEIPDKYADQHFRSLSSFLVHKGELNVDYVGRFERLSDDWEVISSRFGLEPPGKNRRVSGPPVGLDEIPISKEALALLMERYAEDLDRFEYREELESLLS